MAAPTTSAAASSFFSVTRASLILFKRVLTTSTSCNSSMHLALFLMTHLSALSSTPVKPTSCNARCSSMTTDKNVNDVSNSVVAAWTGTWHDARNPPSF